VGASIPPQKDASCRPAGALQFQQSVSFEVALHALFGGGYYVVENHGVFVGSTLMQSLPQRKCWRCELGAMHRCEQAFVR
jgi:hypothetical protein